MKNYRIVLQLLIISMLTMSWVPLKKSERSVTEMIEDVNKSDSVDQEVQEKVYRLVEQMPRFPGCEDLDLIQSEKKACADKKMLEFIYRNLKYPESAKKKGIEGVVVVKFIVEKDGSLSNIEIKKEIGEGAGDEARRVIHLMNYEDMRWTPGMKEGRPVRVQFTLPMKFKL